MTFLILSEQFCKEIDQDGQGRDWNASAVIAVCSTFQQSVIGHWLNHLRGWAERYIKWNCNFFQRTWRMFYDIVTDTECSHPESRWVAVGYLFADKILPPGFQSYIIFKKTIGIHCFYSPFFDLVYLLLSILTITMLKIQHFLYYFKSGLWKILKIFKKKPAK